MLSFRKSKLDKIKSFIRNSKEIEIDNSDKELLIKLIRPTVGIKTKSTDDEKVTIGKSKIGGKPDLPPDFEWPRSNGKPMLFCAQYNLSEFIKFYTDNLLPNNGFFYIFLSLNEKGNAFTGVNQPFKFIFSQNQNIIRTEFPKDLQENQTFKTATLEYFQFYTLPDFDNYKVFEFNKKYSDFFFHFCQPTQDFIQSDLYDYEDRYHQILGFDRPLQSSAIYDFAAKDLGLYTAESSEYKKRWNDIIELSKNYELLLQLDCNDSETDLSKFGESGTYYFGISKSDLENKKFNNVKMTFQIT